MPRQIVSNRFGALLFSFQNIGSSAPPWAHKLQAGQGPPVFCGKACRDFDPPPGSRFSCLISHEFSILSCKLHYKVVSYDAGGDSSDQGCNRQCKDR